MTKEKAINQLKSLIEHFNNGARDINNDDIDAIKYILDYINKPNINISSTFDLDSNMSSKEMFEKANYKLYEETDSWITYRKYPDTIIDDDTYQEIFYNFVDDFVVATEYNHGKLEEKFINRNELLAIVKLIEEFDDSTGLNNYKNTLKK